MAPSSEIVLDKPPTLTTPHRRASEHRFYVAVGILVGLICIVGFGPSIIDPAGRNVPLPMTALVATHSIAGSTFVLLFVVQTILIATGRTSTHRRLGVVGLLAGIVFVVSGVLTNVEEARRGFDLSGDLVRRVHDRLTMGRIHPVSLWGAIGSFAWLFLFFTLVAPTSMWRTFTLWVIQYGAIAWRIALGTDLDDVERPLAQPARTVGRDDHAFAEPGEHAVGA